MNETRLSMQKGNVEDNPVSRRQWPYPYKAAMTICSDLDATPDFATYLEIMRFLNTSATTVGGEGIGLEIGNSIYFLAKHCAYWDFTEEEKVATHALIKSGYVDCLHSIGQTAFLRSDAEKAYEELDRHGCHIEVWVDHSKTPTNFGPDIMCGFGDCPEHEAFHADLAVKYGIKYLWRGRTSGLIGQNCGRSIRGVFRMDHPVQSTLTLAKNQAKVLLGSMGNAKYESVCRNRLLWPLRLTTGVTVYEFLRSNPHWRGPQAATGRDLAGVLTRAVLERLVRVGGVSVIYTHICINLHEGGFLYPETVEGLRTLRDYFTRGEILVTTTRRLLGYCRAYEEVRAHRHVRGDGSAEIVLTHVPMLDSRLPLPARDLQGLTWYVDDPQRVSVTWLGEKLDNVELNPPDETGRSSISVRWEPLVFPGV